MPKPAPQPPVRSVGSPPLLSVSGAILVCAGLWAAVTAALSLKAAPGWAAAFDQAVAAIGAGAGFDSGALAGAALGHLSAIPVLAVMLLCAYGAGWPLLRLLGLPDARAAVALSGHRNPESRPAEGTEIRGGGGALAALAFQLAAGWSLISLAEHGAGLAGLVFPGLLKIQTATLALLGGASALAEKPWKAWRKPGREEWLPLALTIVLLAALVLLTRLPDTHEDARVRHFAAPEHYLLTHKINAEPQHTGWHMSLGYEMAVLVPWALGGMEWAKLANIPFVLGTLLILGSLARRILPERGPGGSPPRAGAAGWWAAVWYSAAGLVFDEVWQGKNDVLVGMYVAAAAWCAIEVVRGRTRWWLGLAWMLGAAAGVKYTIALFLAALLVPLYFHCRRRVTWEWAAWGAGVSAVPLIGWLLASFLFLGNPFHPFLTRIFPQIHWGPFYEQAYHDYVRAISPPETQIARDWITGIWRVLGDPPMGSPGLFALLPLAFLRRGGRGRGYLLVVILASYLLWMPTERVARYLSPLLALAAAAVAAVEIAGDGRAAAWFRRGRIVLGAGAVAAALLNALVHAAPLGCRYLLGQASRAEVLAREFTTWEDLRRWVNDELPASSRILFTGETRRLWFKPRIISNSGLTEPVFWRLTNDSFAIDQVRKRLRQRGITHHAYNFVSADYRETLWYAGPPWSPRQLALYRKFAQHYYRRAFASPRIDNTNGGFYVYEIRERPAPKPEPVHYLPFTEGRFRFARQLVHLKQVDAAWAEAQRVAAPLSDVYQVQYALARIAQDRRDFESAFKLTEPGIRGGFISDGNLIVYAASAVMTGRYAAALPVYLKACRVYTQRDSMFRELAIAYAYRGMENYRRNRFAAAWEDYQQALRWIRDEDSLFINAAMALGRMNRNAEAVSWARRAAGLNPANERARQLLAELEARLPK